MSLSIIMYSKENCPYCIKAKELLHKKKVAFKELRIDLHPELKQDL